MSSSADLPVDKDAAWDWDWSIPKLPARRGSDSGTLVCEVKKKKKYCSLGYIVNFLFFIFAAQAGITSQDTEAGEKCVEKSR